jgi:hypothetical protein
MGSLTLFTQYAALSYAVIENSTLATDEIGIAIVFADKAGL